MKDGDFGRPCTSLSDSTIRQRTLDAEDLVRYVHFQEEQRLKVIDRDKGSSFVILFFSMTRNL